MALQPNKTTGKAVADIQALYFLLHKSGVEPVILSSLDSADWFPVLSLKGTVNASQDAPSLEKINVDQFDAAIGVIAEPGDFNFEAQLPSMLKADIAEWLGTDVEEYNNVISGRNVIGFNLDGKLYDASVLIKTSTGDSIIFTHTQLSISFSKEDKVFIFRVSGQVLAPSNASNKMIYIAHEVAPAPTAIALNKATTSIAVGATETLTVTATPANADPAVVWSSSDPTKATVDQNGVVTGVATASGASAPKIVATSTRDNTKVAECTVTVTV